MRRIAPFCRLKHQINTKHRAAVPETVQVGYGGFFVFLCFLSCPPLLDKSKADGVGSFGSRLGKNVGVHILRCLGTAVSEVVGNDPDRKPGIYQKRCRGVAEVVDMQVGHIIFTEDFLELLVERDPVVEAACGVCEYLLRLFPRRTESKPPLRLPSPVCFQKSEQRLRQG